MHYKKIFLNLNIIANFFFKTTYKFRRITTPNITLQIINTFNPFEEKYFNKKSITNKDVKNVETKPRIKGRKLREIKLLKEEMISTVEERKIAGIPIKKENFTASDLFHPDNSAVEIVTPDLEKPGKIANA